MDKLLKGVDIHSLNDKLKISLFNKVSYFCEHLKVQVIITNE